MKQEKDNLRLVIVGHVDHGKSTLIGRLLFDTDSLTEERKKEVQNLCKEQGKDVEFAFVLDYLEEERDQGITIDTTQIFFKTKKRDYVIIDAPGHKEFIKNMITGASQAEAAILIVDVKEGVKEQTKRHAYILGFLGINQIIVVLNKMDLVGYNEKIYEEVKENLLCFLKKIGIKPTHIIPISAKKGDNVASKSSEMKWYSENTVLSYLDKFRKKSEAEKALRFPIQDIYKIDEKRIVVGRVESGRITKGEEILFLPSKTETKVKTIEVFGKKKTSACAGESIGITTTEPVFVERGEIAVRKNDAVSATNQFVADIYWLSKKPIRIGEKIIIRCSTQEKAATIKEVRRKMNSSSLEIISNNLEEIQETEAAEVMIETKEPMVIERFNDIPELGRFVVVKDDVTVAGGTIKTI